MDPIENKPLEQKENLSDIDIMNDNYDKYYTDASLDIMSRKYLVDENMNHDTLNKDIQNNLTINSKAGAIFTNSSQKYAFVICIFGSDAYVPGLLTACQALREKSNNNIYDNAGNRIADIIVLITPDISKHSIQLIKDFCDYIFIIDYIFGHNMTLNRQIIKRPGYAFTFTKFHCYRLVNYGKIIIVDADHLPYRNHYKLFLNYDTPASCSSIPRNLTICYQKYSRSFNPCVYTNLGEDLDSVFNKQYLDYHHKIPGILLLAWTLGNINKKHPTRYGGISASLLMIQPNMDEFLDIINDLKKPKHPHFRPGFQFPEQQYLTVRYSLPLNYNLNLKQNIDADIQSILKLIGRKNLMNHIQVFKKQNPIYSINGQIAVFKKILLYYFYVYQKYYRGRAKVPVEWSNFDKSYMVTKWFIDESEDNRANGYPLGLANKIWNIDVIIENLNRCLADKTSSGDIFINYFISQLDYGIPRWFEIFQKLILAIGNKLEYQSTVLYYQRVLETYHSASFLKNSLDKIGSERIHLRKKLI